MGKCPDLYLKSDILLLAVFENFRKMCSEIYDLDLTKLISAPGLAWQVALKKTKIKLRLWTDIDMLLTVEEIIRCELCHSINRYAKAIDKYIKDYCKNEELPYLKQLDVNNLYGWEISHKLLKERFI